ncbi:MAG: hypothetical protein V4521_01890, partial [Pseudomonadota bacterium]
MTFPRKVDGKPDVAKAIKRFGRLASRSSISALLMSSAAHGNARAEDNAAANSDAGNASGGAQSETSQSRGSALELPVPLFDRQIVVIGERWIVSQLADVEPEQVYDEDRIASYGASTVGELVDQIRDENGDDQPALLVNGQPVGDIGDISDFPVEAIRKVEALPRGSAARVGGASGQRTYNIVLRPSVKSMTLTGSREVATEGDWSLNRGEALFTLIARKNRLNLAIRASDSDDLFESDRNLTRLDASVPFAPAGNILPFRTEEIDPALSALAGMPVTTIALPGKTARPTLASLLPFANTLNDSRIGEFRTLRGATRPIDASLSGNKTLLPWLSLSFNARIGRTTSSSLNGLPTARFLLQPGHPASPFGVPVVLALSDPARPLRYATTSDSKSVTASLLANWANWQGTLLGRHDERERRSDSILNGSVAGGVIPIDAATDPFGGSLAALIPLSLRTTRSRTTTREARFDVQGPLLALPTGSVQLRAGIGASGTSLNATDATGRTTAISRNEWNIRGGVTVPLTARGKGFPGFIGDTDLSADLSRQSLGRFGRIDEH